MEQTDVETLYAKETTNKIVKTCSTLKDGCKASVRVSLDTSTMKWKVKNFEDKHNHKIVTPSKRMKMMSNRKIAKATKDLTEAFHQEKFLVGKIPSILGAEKIGLDSKDCYNHL